MLLSNCHSTSGKYIFCNDRMCWVCCSLLGHEGLEVVNPEGGQEDVEEEAIRGRFKQEVSTIRLASKRST